MALFVILALAHVPVALKLVHIRSFPDDLANLPDHLAGPLTETPARSLKRSVQYSPDFHRANAVKEAFQFAWNGYSRYALPNDELHPVSNSYGNSRNGWGASAVDALSTAIIMELPDVVNEILNHVPNIDFRYTDDVVSVFETTIRYLGSMLSGYDLLTGPFSHVVNDDDWRVKTLLDQAANLGKYLSPAFNTPSGIPDNNINITTGALQTFDQSTGLAVAGSLVMEWTRLSDLLNNPYYANLAQKAEEQLLRPLYAPPFEEPWPGLEGMNLNYTTGLFTSADGGWIGGSDSFYEYLIKMWVYDSEQYGEYKDRWMAAADSTIDHLMSNPSSRPELSFVAMYSSQSLSYASQHLAGFIGGNFLLGGLVLDRQDYIAAGLKFTAAWHETYAKDVTRIGPEGFAWIPNMCSSSNSAGNGSSNSSPSLRHRDADTSPQQTRIKGHPGKESHGMLKQNSYNERIATTAQLDVTATPESCVLPTDDEAHANFSAASGFVIQADSYGLRPEVMESYYYAYRITGDSKYQEWAWDAFVAINSTARIGSGFSSFSGVNGGTVEYGDNQESFFFAELMKYAFLIFAEDGPWQVNSGGNGGNEFVYNTEAHPLRARNPLSSRKM